MHDTQYTFLSYPAHFILEWEIFQTNVVEKIKTHILWSEKKKIFFRKSCRSWENVEKYSRAGKATDDHIVCIPTATNTHSEYIILIAFPQQQRLQERASILRYTVHSLPVSFYISHLSWSWHSFTWIFSFNLYSLS